MDNNAKTNKILYVWGAIIIFVIILISLAYGLGYRSTGGLSFGKVGKVKMEIPLSGTTIFIDQSRKIITSRDNEKVELSLSPREHEIIVSREGYYPWTKTLEIRSDSNSRLSPIFVTINTSGVVITKNDKDYTNIMNSVLSDILPTKDSPRVSKNGEVKTWVEKDKIIADVKGETKTVLEPETPVRNLDFYKDRNDSLIFSTSKGVFVVEIDKEGTQNFMPIYNGNKPRFVKPDVNYIYLEDNGILMQVNI